MYHALGIQNSLVVSNSGIMHLNAYLEYDYLHPNTLVEMCFNRLIAITDGQILLRRYSYIPLKSW